MRAKSAPMLIRIPFLVGFALLAWIIPAWADAPPAEFWQYLLEYGNDQGEVLDPLDLDTVSHMDDKADAASSTTPAVPSAQKEKE